MVNFLARKVLAGCIEGVPLQQNTRSPLLSVHSKVTIVSQSFLISPAPSEDPSPLGPASSSLSFSQPYQPTWN